ncbi:MAC/Perforin domain-containing protein [Jimgerdemannia flammicorona]|uniref:MAC/Perforin domain-containing protein n=1 Tax=Jimgerdemannia flammicorona TaxID=994334 RepID=A0A433Q9Q2_9FUNG|nr:MAC/Perforin domain-containing protein [Jimgerdemannia flammicorona]
MLFAIRFTIFERTIDLNRPNVVFVLTHIGLIQKKKLQTTLTEQRSAIRKMGQRILGLSREDIRIVEVENDCKDYEYEKKGDWFVQPNDELFPLNLFDTLQKLAERSHDDVGREAMALYFSNRGAAAVQLGHEVKEDDIQQDPDAIKEIDELKGYFERIVVDCKKSEIRRMLDEQVKNMGKDDPLRQDADVLAILLHVKGISSIADLPKSMSEFAEFFDNMHMSPQMAGLVKKSFGINQQKLSSDLVVGYSYNPKKDCPTANPVFNLGEYKETGINFSLPEFVQAVKACETVGDTTKTGTQKEYHDKRMIDLGIFSNSSAEDLHISVDEEHNVTNSNKRTTELNNTQVVDERRIFKLSIDPIKTPLSEEFKMALRQLPTTYEPHEYDNAAKWDAFFERWGTHSIIGAYGGGMMVITKMENKTTADSNVGSSARPKLSVDFWFGNTDAQGNAQQSNPKKFAKTDSSENIRFYGGNDKYHSASVNHWNEKSHECWIDSIRTNPAVLTRDLTVVPFSLLTDSDPEYRSLTNAMVAATKALLGSNAQVDARLVTSDPSEKEEDTPSTREDATNQISLARDLLRLMGMGTTIFGTSVTAFGLLSVARAVSFAGLAVPGVGGLATLVGIVIWLYSRCLNNKIQLNTA